MSRALPFGTGPAPFGLSRDASQAEPLVPSAVTFAELLEAGERITNDYQSSDAHHPDHYLIRRTDFEGLVSAIAKVRGDA